jgi:hypothetical protein
MGVFRFEDLRMWQGAKAQSDHVGEWLKRPYFRQGRTKDQGPRLKDQQ